MAEAAWINADGGAPEYDAQELRRIQAMHLYPGVSDAFGARSGVRPHSQDVVTVSGTTWTQHDLAAVVYPGITSDSGPYIVEKAAEAAALNPADGSNPRIDALDLQVRDDDEDASGFRDVRVVYVPGTPASSPTADPVTDNSLRLATILVPAGGSPAPSVETLAAFTVAAGGILPVRDGATLPTSGLHEGAYADQDGALQRWTDGEWLGVASPHAHQRVVISASDNFVKGDYPWASRARVHLKGGGGAGGGADGTTGAQASFGGGGGAGEYVEFMIDFADLSSSEAVSIGAAGTGVSAATGNGGGTTSFHSWTAVGGDGGFNRDVFAAEVHAARGGHGGSGGTNGGDGTLIMRLRGEPGTPGVGGPQGDFNSIGGNGGSGPFGSGGAGNTTAGSGQSGNGYGAGGAGEKNGPSQSARAGNNGTAGVAIFDLYA